MPLNGAVDEYLAKEFGGIFRAIRSSVTTGAAAVRAALPNPERIGLVMVNLGVNNILVSPDQTVSATAGVLLIANGGSLSVVVRDDGILSALEWWVVSPAGASTLFMLEMVRDTALPLAPTPSQK